MTRVLDALDESGVRHWVGGGCRVAVLVGRQTRGHRDLDLAVDADDVQACLLTLNDLGYVTETDYPPSAFTAGALNGRRVNCLSVRQQREFHADYEHQAKDIHDLAQLDAVAPRRCRIPRARADRGEEESPP